jgi:uncharacterized protein
MNNSQEKLKKLYDYIGSLDSLAVAFSGGVDSSFLLKCAHDVLGSKSVAITVKSPFFAARELKESKNFCAKYGIEQIIIDYDELTDVEIAKNPPDRCYHCKKALFSIIDKVTKEKGIHNIAEGSNMDDLGDYRPGLKAVAESGALSPLLTAGLYKAEIRALSRQIGLETWDKPSYACLASRIPYGEMITYDKLAAIENAEQFLIDLGFRQMRVRHHGDIARIELLPKDMKNIFENGLAAKIDGKLKELGFKYVALDLKGYTVGSLNSALDKNIIEQAKIS